MKKIYFLIIALILCCINLYSQPCTPGSYTAPGIYPDSASGLPQAYVNSVYSTVITVVVPTDTVLFSMPFIVDSIGIVSVSGLPAGFAYSSEPANGFIHGGASGCVLITGNPSPAQVGSYPIDISLINYVNSSPTGLSQTNTAYYTIHILDTLVNSEIAIPVESKLQLVPNPFEYETMLNYSSVVDENVIFYVFNGIGQKVFEKTLEVKIGFNSFDLSFPLSKGMYYYMLSGKNTQLNGKMIIR